MIRIVNIVDYIDLRLLTTTAANLENIAKKFNLRNGEAAAFVNFNRTRFRLVVKLANIVHLAIPGRDWCLSNDEFIRVAGEYRKIVTTKEAVKRLDSLQIFNRERTTRREARAKTVRVQKKEFQRKRANK